jgi:hypothetical protein
MKLCCGLMDGLMWDATLQPSPEGGSESGVVVVLSNEEVLSPQNAVLGEFAIAEATEAERRSLEQAGYNMPDWDPAQWLGCAGCHSDHSDVEEQPDGPAGSKP